MTTTDLVLIVDPTSAQVTPTNWTLTVLGFARDTPLPSPLLDPATGTLVPELPEPLFRETVTGNASDTPAAGVERARVAIEEQHQAAQRQAARLAVLRTQLAPYLGVAVPVSVEDASA